eukprot:13088741-Ditylum_brightwellii.AAC.1
MALAFKYNIKHAQSTSVFTARSKIEFVLQQEKSLQQASRVIKWEAWQAVSITLALASGLSIKLTIYNVVAKETSTFASNRASSKQQTL